MVLRFVFVKLAVAVLLSATAKADVLFEGYSKVISGGVHIGYTIARYEFDNKKKRFTASTFLKTSKLGGEVTESLKAIANDKLEPISFAYTLLAEGKTKTIDATFEKGMYKASIKDGAKVEKISKKLPKGVFLSSFLAYVMLKSPKGISADTKYDYQAIAEEDGSIVKGTAVIKNTEMINGIKAYRVLNDFKDSKFISYLSEKGDVLSTKSPVQAISTELVPQSSLATGNFPVPSALLKTLFGSVPLGVQNAVAKKYQEMEKKPVAAQIPSPNVPPQMPEQKTVENPGKQEGVPQGQGLHLKGGQEAKQDSPSTPTKGN